MVLKTLGLVALMARTGIPIPAAPGARVDLFDPVLADIGDLQSVTGDLSTFSGHLVVRVVLYSVLPCCVEILLCRVMLLHMTHGFVFALWPWAFWCDLLVSIRCGCSLTCVRNDGRVVFGTLVELCVCVSFALMNSAFLQRYCVFVRELG